jgi:hypothetical protein
MPTDRARKPSARLGMEILEDRTVPTTFGANQGQSLAVGDVIPGGSQYEYVTGSGPGKVAQVRVFNASGVLQSQFNPFGNFKGGINVAVGTVTGVISNIVNVASAKINSGGLVNVTTTNFHNYSVGQTVTLKGVVGVDTDADPINTYTYDGTFRITAVTSPFSFQYVTFPPTEDEPEANGGACGVDPKAIIVSTGAGTLGRVKVYAFIDNQLRQLAVFTPFGPKYTGGIQLAVGDVYENTETVTIPLPPPFPPITFTQVNPVSEIIVGQQTGGSWVKAFTVNLESSGKQYTQVRAVQAFAPTYRGGVSIAATNIDSTPNNAFFPDYDYDYAEIIVGRATGNSLLKIYDVQQTTPNLRASYFAFDGATRGVNVAAGNTDGLRGGEIYVSLKNSTNVKIISGQTGVPVGSFSVPYPAVYGRNLEIAINDRGENIVTDLFVVAGDGPYNQVPIVFKGRFASPAGLNGSRPAV